MTIKEKYDFVVKKIQEAVPEIMEFPEPENWWLTTVEIQGIFKNILGEQYQKRFNKNLDYDQWCGIIEAMEVAGRQASEKIAKSLSLNREAIGREIRLADILAVIEKRDIEEYKKASFWLDVREQYDLLHDSLSWHAEHKPELIEWLYEILK